MVHWTEDERAIIHDIFDHADYEDLGPKSLIRCLIVYPWTQRYFGKFGNIFSPEAIKSNKLIAEHGVKVLRGLDLGLKNLDHIKETYHELNILHSQTLHVDPDNFKLLSHCITYVIAGKMGHDFTPEIQAALEKFLGAVVSALGRRC